MDHFHNEYRSLVKVIKDEEITDSVHQKALQDLLRLFSQHLKENREEALKYTKGAILHLFKNGKLRGLTENLKGLKPTYIGIMQAVNEEDMKAIGLTYQEKKDFHTLLEKLLHELEFLEHSSHDDVNRINSEGLDDDEVYELKIK